MRSLYFSFLKDVLGISRSFLLAPDYFKFALNIKFKIILVLFADKTIWKWLVFILDFEI